MLTIVMVDGQVDAWEKDEYTDYCVQHGLFVVLNDKQWVGIYNISSIKKVVYGWEEESK